MSALRVAVEGLGLWTPELGNVEALRALLAGDPVAPPSARPAAATLPPNERRRAPESVLLATEVADQAVAMSGRAASELACVFTSSHGDQTITDYMCATLATTPTELSPTKFHNSVHNAPVGYWTIATGCHAASTAVCAHTHSFGAGLLEAVTLVLAETRPVLLVCSDISSSGPLREVTGCEPSFGAAMVLAPVSDDAARTTLTLRLRARGEAIAAALPEPLAALRAGNPAAGALDLLVPLLRGAAHARLAASPSMELDLDMEYPG